ncbi:hypothetical protein TB2_014729 [Malus domestica]
MIKKQRLLPALPIHHLPPLPVIVEVPSKAALFPSICEVLLEVYLCWGRSERSTAIALADAFITSDTASEYKTLAVSSGFVGFVVFFC